MAILPAGDHRGGPRGVKVFRGHLDSADVTVVDGIRVTSPVRTAWDAATLTDPASALAITDGLLRRNLMTPGQLRLVAEERSGTWGVCRARKVFDLADGLSESPAESWTRWLLHESCIPPAVLQFEVLDERQHLLARVDFGWPDQKVALEYDGAHHDEPLQQVKDQRRDAALTKMGWTVIHMTASDLRDPSRVLHALRQALVR